MPPSLDVYVVSKRRDRTTIERFLERWIDRPASEDRRDEELMMLPLGATDASANVAWEWEPALTLTHAIQRGVDVPSRAFVLYLKPRESLVDAVTVGFTADDRVVFGVSVDDPLWSDDRLVFAKDLLLKLADEVEADSGYIAAEEPAPLFAATIPPKDASRVLFSWARAV
jgi:hypothetical protein